MKTIVPEDWDLPAQFRARFGDSAGRQRAMSANGHLLLVLHQPPGPNDRERDACLIWRRPDGVWQWTSDGTTTNLLKRHILSFASKVEQLENQLQSACCAADYFELLQAITPLHRTCRNLHTTLQAARDMVVDDKDVIIARDAAGDLERAFELLHNDAKNGLDFTAAQKAELQSQRSYEMAMSAHRLNLLAALFFPVTAISSIFGMNFSSGLESIPGQWLFWGILGGGLLTGILLTQIIAQKPAPVEQTGFHSGDTKTSLKPKLRTKVRKPTKSNRPKIPAV